MVRSKYYLMKHYLTLVLSALLAVVSATPFASAQNSDAVQLIENIPYAALDKKGVDKTLITVEGGGHGREFGSKPTELVEAFFDHHLRGNKTRWSDQSIQAVPREQRR